jgi:hypothetical protein
MTTTVGKVVHGLDAVREYHVAKLVEVAENSRKEERDRIWHEHLGLGKDIREVLGNTID